MASKPRPQAPPPAPPLTAVADVQNQIGAVAALGREEAEYRGAIASARYFPRDPDAAAERILKLCEDPIFAEDAEYSYKRGKKEVDGQWVDNYVDGLSVDFAREATGVWGNVRYGLRILSLDENYLHLAGAGIDLETNTMQFFEDKFRLLIYRRDQGWVKPDERDLRELQNRRGAICVRNALLGLLPAKLKRDAHAKIKQTKRLTAMTALKDRDKAIRDLVASFSKYKVTREMLERYIGHPLETITPDEYATLSGVGRSIRDGNTTVADQFGNGQKDTAAAPTTATVDDIMNGVGESDIPPSEHPSAAKKAENTPPNPPGAPPAGAPSTPVGDAPKAPGRSGRLF